LPLQIKTQALVALQEAGELQKLRLALGSVEGAVYDWSLADDRIEWTENAPTVFGAEAFGTLLTGQGLQSALDERFRQTVDEAIAHSLVSGESFRIEYILALGGGQGIWVEDCGVCLKHTNGNAARIIGMMRNITERKLLEERLAYLAAYDELTGQLNRASLREALFEVTERVKKTDAMAAFLVVGIDHLAILNEDYGYDVADQVILTVSQRIASAVTQGDIIGRAGGNKLGVILTDCNGETATTAAHQILEAVRGSVVRTSKGPVVATVSVGGVMIPAGSETASEAMARAEEALVHAKQFGRDAFRFYRPSLRRESLRRQNISMADQIISALDEDRILIAYQPIVDSKTGKIDCYECLARMATREGEILSAQDWIPVAERLGLIRRIDRRMADIALDVLGQAKDISLALNVSASTATDGGWIRAFLTALNKAPDAASRLTVELTETLALRDIEESSKFISRLREIGCRVAIDDFGAGYTSFKNLQYLDVDMVKIDGSFIQRLQESEDNQLFVRTLIALARNFNVQTVAEWVLNEADAALLRSFGVDFLQGYFIGAPETVPAFLNRVELKAQYGA
jgi:diguanylate cyclase (GGDEF)-like protein